VATIYSERFIVATGDNVYTSWFVPAGKRAVLKRLTGGNQNSQAGSAFLLINAFQIYVHNFPAAIHAFSDELRVTVYGGEQIRVYTSSALLKVTVDGYLFDDPNHATGPPGAQTRVQMPAATPLPSIAERLELEIPR